MTSKRNPMDLVEERETICSRCGTEYRTDQNPPEDAAYYWVSTCPDCGAKITDNPTTQSWLNILSGNLDKEDEDYDNRCDTLNAQARLYHGRMHDTSVEELIKIAKWFDRMAKIGTAYGPRFHRPIAFALRRQARKQL